jgi:hypothetical protein
MRPGCRLQLPGSFTGPGALQRSLCSPRRLRAGSAGRSRAGTSVHPRGGPAVLPTIGRVRPGSSAGGRWPGATLRPPEAREAHSGPSMEEVPAQHVPITRPVLAMMEGGNSYPSCIEQALSLRDT